jgi:predicted metal-dependent peptidase
MASPFTYTAFELIKKGKIKMLKAAPFYACLLMHADVKENSAIPTIGITQHGLLYYNADYIMSLKEEELDGELKHEVWHKIYMHHARSHNFRLRNPKISHSTCNLAQDFLIDVLLLNDGVTLAPQWASRYDAPNQTVNMPIGPDPKTGKMRIITITELNLKTWEQVAVELHDLLPKDQRSGNIPGYDPDVMYEEEKHENQDDQLMEEDLPQEWKRILAQAVIAGKQAGKLPGNIEGIAGHLLEAKVPWQTRLRRFITEVVKFNFTFAKPHRKSQVYGYVIPTMTKEGMDCVVAIDTSGSIYSYADRFLSEINALLGAFPQISCTLLEADVRIQLVKELSAFDKDNSHWVQKSGGGGTSHMDVCRWVTDNKPCCRLLLLLTDGLSDIPEAIKLLPGSCSVILIGPEGCANKNMDSLVADVIEMD